MPELLSAIEQALSRRPSPPEHPDPEDVCMFCEGRGWVRWLDTRHPRHQACLICGGVATLGLYLVECAADRWRYQLRYQSPDFAAACRRAEGAAQRLRRSTLGVRAVHVLYAPLVDEPQRVPTVVYSVPVLPRVTV